MVVDISSVQEAERVLRVRQRRYWTVRQIQACQQLFCGRHSRNGGGGGGGYCEEDVDQFAPVIAPPRRNSNQATENGRINRGPTSASNSPHHHGGLLKRTQGEYLKNFLAHMILRKLDNSRKSIEEEEDATTSTWAMTDISPQQWVRVRDYLNQGSGVLDVAGGSGHVSMALGLCGIRSTIVSEGIRPFLKYISFHSNI